MHRTLARAFAPDRGVCAGIAFSGGWSVATGLWSAGASSGALPSVVLIQSAQPADWSVLGAFPSRLRAEEIRRQQGGSTWMCLLQAGARYRFPPACQPDGDSRVGKRYGLTREDDQLAWVARQGERHGFSVLGCVRGCR
jgi:CRISPR system Cascade subunit CasE